MRSESTSFYNPYKKNNPRRHLLVGWLILLIFFTCWIVLMLFLPYFQIKQINYSGLKIISQPEVENEINPMVFRSRVGIPLNNYFLINKKKLSELLLNKWPLNSVTINKNFPNTINITIEEKKPVLIYDNGDKYFFLDQAGTAIKFLTDVSAGEWSTTTIAKTANAADLLATTTTYSTVASTTNQRATTVHLPDYLKIQADFGILPILYDERGLPLEEKQNNIISTDLISSLIETATLLQKNGIARLSYAQMDDPNAGLVLYLSKPWQIYTRVNDIDVPGQINILKTFLRDNTPTKYIDLRFKDHIYWQ